MGHADLSTTQIYAQVQVDHLREVAGRLSPLVAVYGHSFRAQWHPKWHLRPRTAMDARNVSGTQPLKLAVFQVGAPDAPFVVPVD